LSSFQKPSIDQGKEERDEMNLTIILVLIALINEEISVPMEWFHVAPIIIARARVACCHKPKKEIFMKVRDDFILCGQV